MKLLLFFTLHLAALGAEGGSIQIVDVEVTCANNKRCNPVKEQFQSLKGFYDNQDVLSDKLKAYSKSNGINYFEYQIVEKKKNYKLWIKIKLADLVEEIVFKTIPERDIEFPSVLPLSGGDYYSKTKDEETKKLIISYLESQGYPDAKIKSIYKEQFKDFIEYEVTLNKKKQIKKIFTDTKSKFLKQLTQRTLSHHIGRALSISDFRTTIDELREQIFDYGYYLADLSYEFRNKSYYDFQVYIKIERPFLFSFNIKKSNYFNMRQIKEYIRESTRSATKKIDKEFVFQKLKEMYAKAAFLKPKFTLDEVSHKTRTEDRNTTFHLEIDEGPRSAISDIIFQGVTQKQGHSFRRFFYEMGPDIIKSGHYVEDYVKAFPALLKDKMIQDGFVSASVDEPKIRFSENKVFISYRVIEGLPAVIARINVSGVDSEVKRKMLEAVDLSVGQTFNPATFPTTLKDMEASLHKQGYYFAEIENRKSTDLVTYTNENSEVIINLVFSSGELTKVNKISVLGNHRTLDRTITRELRFKRGDFLTQNSIRISKTSLVGLNLFSRIEIIPQKRPGNLIDVVVIVQEKDFGVIEFSPGIRTDLGIKFDGAVNYNNIDGLGKKLSLRGRVNQRFNLEVLDERRQVESNSLVEYNVIANYSENYLFDYNLSFDSSISQSRRRFFSFDADIQRLNFTFTKSLFSWLSLSTRYQIERITQFDATQELDDGTFQIGSMTPSLTADFRNSAINPTSGAWFDWSYEIANPNLASQDNEDLKVDYFKTVLRNRYYIPFPGGTLAMSAAAGYQRNLATRKVVRDGVEETKGYIPNIKVFRLNGLDIVRGYEDSEINTLGGGVDISEVRVDNEAYMAVVKIEPRFFLTDHTILGVFYDAGRVFVDDFDFSKLRDAVGVSFKYLTPVGTLNFDYGIKLLSEDEIGDSYVAPGRLHVSIGFF